MRNLKIRYVLAMLLSAMAVITLLVVAWGSSRALDELREAERLLLFHGLTEQTLLLASNLAKERGITSLALAMPDKVSPELEEHIASLRRQNQAYYQATLDTSESLLRHTPQRRGQLALAEFRERHADLEEARQAAGRMIELGHTGGASLFSESITSTIESSSVLREVSRAAHRGSWLDKPMFRELLYSATELAGRERAQIAMLIATGRRFGEEEYLEIMARRHSVNLTLERIALSLDEMLWDKEVEQALEEMRSHYFGEYQTLRNEVITAGKSGASYPIDAYGWFQQSSHCIDTIIQLGTVVNGVIAQRIAERMERARMEVGILFMLAAFVIISFLFSLSYLRNRFVRPLKKLEDAAVTIGRGDYSQPLAMRYRDEFGQLGTAIERMRVSLLDELLAQQRAEGRLRTSMERFRSLVESTGDWLWEVDREGRYTYASPQVEEILGYSAEEIIGLTPFDLMPPDEAEHTRLLFTRLAARQETMRSLINVNLHRDGHTVVLETSGVPFRDENGEFKGYRGIDRDITWRRQAEDQQLKLLRVVEQTDDAVMITDPDGIIEYVNSAFERVTGYAREEVLGEHCRLLNSGQQDDAFYRRLWTTITNGKPFQSMIVNRRKDGSFYHEEKTITPLRDHDGHTTHYLSTSKDITERRRMDEQLQQSEKLASIGQLAAGVAHEINNPVGYISSNISSLNRYMRELFELLSLYEEAESALISTEVHGRLSELKERIDLAYLREDIYDLLQESDEGVGRVRKIVQDLKDFSRQESADWQLFDLHKGLESTLNIVHNEIKYKAEVKREYGELPEVECIPSQLNQVFMNLLVNAAQAIEKDGVIHVRTGQEGGGVWVEVEDNGQGISAEHLGHLFEPFFTTKPVGMGTGLGLSLAYGIIQKHGGEIQVDSEQGRGTRFHIWLPVRQQTDDNE